MKKIVASASGASMKPYLRDDDIVILDEITNGENLPLGGIVLAEDTSRNLRLLHRVVSTLEIKGDRVKDIDGLTSGNLRLVGLLQGRLTSRGYVSYQNPWIKRAHRLQARLSNINRRGGKLSKLAVGLLIIVGWKLRLVENLLAERRS